MIYFDNAATSWPKPPSVPKSMAEAVEHFGANPGRGGHRLSIQASRVVADTRKQLATLFGVSDPANIIFFHNATAALNQAIKGFKWGAGDHIIATTYEHNSVRRPLENLRQERQVEITYIQPDHNGSIDMEHLEAHIRTETKLIVTTHVSNLTGAILPIDEIGQLSDQYQVPFLVDAAQSAGMLPIDVQEASIDLLAFPGHKGLYGPQGTGGLYISPTIDLIPLLHGGTGSHSEMVEQPLIRPDRYEAGTMNTPGIAGWGAGIQFVQGQGIEQIMTQAHQLTTYALHQLNQMEGIYIYGPDVEVKRAPVIAFNLEGVDAHECALILDEHYQIATRAGLHCSPLGHQSIHTEEKGAIRISFGIYNQKEEIDQLIAALQEIKIGFTNL